MTDVLNNDTKKIEFVRWNGSVKGKRNKQRIQNIS